ncbi:hypothetical protein GC56T2_0530 [Geobacillus sp. C56-T2]|nr:hypothetical protein GC56T2_0530 [Geobacillus sp. C56-T2]
MFTKLSKSLTKTAMFPSHGRLRGKRETFNISEVGDFILDRALQCHFRTGINCWFSGVLHRQKGVKSGSVAMERAPNV